MSKWTPEEAWYIDPAQPVDKIVTKRARKPVRMAGQRAAPRPLTVASFGSLFRHALDGLVHRRDEVNVRTIERDRAGIGEIEFRRDGERLRGPAADRCAPNEPRR